MQKKPTRPDQERAQFWDSALEWVMTQPGLLETLPGGPEPLLSSSDPRLDRLRERMAKHPDELLAQLSGPRGHKIGIIYETLIRWGAIHGLGYECLAQDLQIREGTRTLGALDLLLRSPQGEVEHWELAYKLYLQAHPGTHWESWVGPAERDRLDIKLHRMQSHQLPLSARPEARDALEALGIQRIDRRRVFLGGVLFSRWDEEPSTVDSGTHPARGRWVRPSELGELTGLRPGSTWVHRERPRWFGPWTRPHDRGVSAQEFRRHLTDTPPARAQLWVRRATSDFPSAEVFFVVPEGWGS